MRKVSAKALRTLTQKGKAKAALRLGHTLSGPDDLSLDQRLQRREVGTGEVWVVGGQPLARNQVVEMVAREVSGGESIPALCRRSGMPSIHQFMGWLRHNPTWKAAIQQAEEIRAITLSEEALDRSRESARMCGGDPARVKGDELFVKTAQWMSERLDRKKFGADAPLQDLKDELRHASNEMLIARVVGAITTAPALLERLAPKLQAILPPESMALLAETALKARQAQAVPGELVQDPPAEVQA